MSILIISLLWLIFGSFGSVIFFRLGDFPSRTTFKGFLFGRSQCQYCKHPLQTQDLLPIVSFLRQKGKCRYCKKQLSRRYPILEGGTWLIFISVFLRMTDWASLLTLDTKAIRMLVATQLALRLSFLILLYDIYCYELHTTASIGLFLLSMIHHYVLGTPLRTRINNIVLISGIFLCIYGASRLRILRKYQKNAEGFGFWDVLFAIIIGSFFPLVLDYKNSWERTILFCCFISIACLSGMLIYLFLSLKKKEKTKKADTPRGELPITQVLETTPIPFLPAMIISLLILFMIQAPLLKFFNLSLR